MTLEAAVNGLPRVFEEFKEAIKLETETIAMVGYAKIKDRIQETGKDSNEQPWKPYTKEYQKFKTDAGKYSGKVDLTLNNRMLNNIGIVESKINDTLAVVVISGRSAETNLKLEGNEKKRPGILNVSKKEETVLQEDFVADMEEQIKIIMVDYL